MAAPRPLPPLTWRLITPDEPARGVSATVIVTNGRRWRAAFRDYNLGSGADVWRSPDTASPLDWEPTHYLTIPPLPQPRGRLSSEDVLHALDTLAAGLKREIQISTARLMRALATQDDDD